MAPWVAAVLAEFFDMLDQRVILRSGDDVCSLFGGDGLEVGSARGLVWNPLAWFAKVAAASSPAFVPGPH